MLIADLVFTDFAIIAAIVALLSLGGASTSGRFRQRDRLSLQRIEAKVDLLLTHFDLKLPADENDPWKEIADDPYRKIEAIKIYREHYGSSLAEAKEAVEDYIAKKS